MPKYYASLLLAFAIITFKSYAQNNELLDIKSLIELKSEESLSKVSAQTIKLSLKKQKLNLAMNSGNEAFDEELNLMLKLSLSFMDNWLQQSAEFVLIAIQNPTLSQEEIGVKLGINQAAVSRRQKRSNFELMMQVEHYFRKKVKTLEV